MYYVKERRFCPCFSLSKLYMKSQILKDGINKCKDGINKHKYLKEMCQITLMPNDVQTPFAKESPDYSAGLPLMSVHAG